MKNHSLPALAGFGCASSGLAALKAGDEGVRLENGKADAMPRP